jgi:hypothetical protein
VLKKLKVSNPAYCDKLLSMRKIPLILTIIIVLLGAGLRISMFTEMGKDFQVYIEAIDDYKDKINPYQNTIESFSNPDEMYDH